MFEAARPGKEREAGGRRPEADSSAVGVTALERSKIATGSKGWPIFERNNRPFPFAQ